MMTYEYGGDLIVVDAGLMFPEEAMPGVDLVIPDIRHLVENQDKIRGIFLTHGHEDHIGALPYILREIDVPLYGTPLTLGLISEKLKEHGLAGHTRMVPVRPREVIRAGENFQVEFIRVTHSIVDGAALGITTPVGRVVHTGDFKVDYTPVDGELFDFQRFSEYGERGTLVLLSDSTNAEKEGHTLSEREVGRAFVEIFHQAKRRIIVATFASNIHRIQQVIDTAARFGRKVIISGRSMVNNARIASEMGYLNYPASVRADMEYLPDLPPEKTVLVTTGSIRVEEGDTVLLSARMIPGNERAISQVINHLFRRGANVIYEPVSDIHVSGHAYREEQKMMLNLVRPKFFIPIHGEYRQLVNHARLAEEMRMPKENILILEDGDVARFTRDGGQKDGRVPSGRVFVDGKGIGDVGSIVLRDRQHLGEDGILIVMMGIEKTTGKVASGPEIISRGFVFEDEAQDLFRDLRETVLKLLEEMDPEIKADGTAVKARIAQTLRRYLIKKMDRKPMIIPIIYEG
ncbi:MAG: ribonuclease J [Nitrospirae bacterium]|nr:ribonuclease J [Nitrospirota bacterium]